MAEYMSFCQYFYLLREKIDHTYRVKTRPALRIQRAQSKPWKQAIPVPKKAKYPGQPSKQAARQRGWNWHLSPKCINKSVTELEQFLLSHQERGSSTYLSLTCFPILLLSSPQEIQELCWYAAIGTWTWTSVTRNDEGTLLIVHV